MRGERLARGSTRRLRGGGLRGRDESRGYISGPAFARWGSVGGWSSWWRGKKKIGRGEPRPIFRFSGLLVARLALAVLAAAFAAAAGTVLLAAVASAAVAALAAAARAVAAVRAALRVTAALGAIP